LSHLLNKKKTYLATLSGLNGHNIKLRLPLQAS